MSGAKRANGGEAGDGLRRDPWWLAISKFLYLAVALGLFFAVLAAALAVILQDLLLPLTSGASSGLGDAPEGSAETLASQLLNRFGPATLLLAGFVAVLSIPLVLYRAWLQERTIRKEEATEETDRRRLETTDAYNRDSLAQQAETAAATLQAQRDAATVQNQTERLLRAMEMLGASEPSHSVETVTVTEQAVSHADGSIKEIRREIPVPAQVPNIEVRLGAITILEKLAKEAVPGAEGPHQLANHWPVMETVLAYIRRRRGPPEDIWAGFDDAHPKPAGYDGWPKETPEEERVEAPAAERIAYAKAKEAWLRDPSRRAVLKPAADDVNAALAVLRRRDGRQHAHELGLETAPEPIDWRAFEKEHPEPAADAPPEARAAAWAARSKARAALLEARRAAAAAPRTGNFAQLDLGATSLRGADLSSAVLSDLDLRGARLEGADHREARLEGADLSGARLEGADLREARLEGANLRWARLEGADLGGARLEGATLFRARLEGAFLFKARLAGATLTGARLEGADLFEARLEGVGLFGARLAGADLRFARMEGADLGGARLEGATLLQARMAGVDLRGARLTAAVLFRARMAGALVAGTVFSSAESGEGLDAKRLSQNELNRTLGDGATVLPDGLERPAHWPNEPFEDWDAADRAWAAWRKAEGYPALPRHEKFVKDGA